MDNQFNIYKYKYFKYKTKYINLKNIINKIPYVSTVANNPNIAHDIVDKNTKVVTNLVDNVSKIIPLGEKIDNLLKEKDKLLHKGIDIVHNI